MRPPTNRCGRRCASSRPPARTLADRAALDRGYGYAGLLGAVVFAFHALISFFGGEDAFRDLWMVSWFPYLFIAFGLPFGAQTVHYAIRTGFHRPLTVVAMLAPLYLLFALANLGIELPGTRWLLLKYAAGVAVSLMYAGLCMGVACYWFALGRSIDE